MNPDFFILSTSHWKIRIVSLEGDEDRRKPLEDKLSEFGLEYEVVTGVDGRNGLAPAFEAQIDRTEAARRMRRPLTDAEFACALSHRSIHQMVVSGNEDGCIILEDDAIIGPGFARFVRDRAYEPYEMLMLDFGQAYVARKSRPVGDRRSAHRIYASPDLSTGYCISGYAARRLLKAATPVAYVADWPLPLWSLRAYCIHPRLVDHPEPGVNSHIDEDRKKLQAMDKGKTAARYLTGIYWRERWQKRGCLRLRNPEFLP